MPLQVYSTLTRKKEPFHKQPGDSVSMYVCGPTVYKPSHIGHMVGPVIFDTVKRYLTYLGYNVKFVINITDVDDKLIVEAGKQKTTVPELAGRITKDYQDSLKKLNVTGIDAFPKATEHIPGMIAMMERLIAKGYAYPAGGDVYFDVSKDEDYGKLCNRDPEQLEAGSRIEVSEKKRNPGDFALWKGAKPNEPPEVQFDSPWGKGRPGWHIECSVMSQALLGETLDIHGGGLDLQFPHHENELAQSESDTGKPFARYWMHNGLMRIEGEKISKTHEEEQKKKATLIVSEVLQKYAPETVRFLLLSSHYRSPIEYSNKRLDELNTALQAFYRFFERYERIAGESFYSLRGVIKVIPEAKYNIIPLVTGYRTNFWEFMDDDFNTGGASGVLFELLTGLNRFADQEDLEQSTNNAGAKAAFQFGVNVLRELANILGLFWEPPAKASLGGGDQLVAGLMQLLLDLRANLRTEAKAAAKDNPLKKAMFDQTDLIRQRLADLKVTLEDRPGGTTWRVG
ncbi:cysteine--tRNA ligase [Fimbriiglobus ruber]|uniref:Cysteine--tRNA ligase n=1 Tax=Fimbriiglobus ruber TaxID=1908690 RepID=A0A225E761_9BACT|nr:cysteine--tRNA ligase [Fimbriiglobus ruber]OWK45349.1 Cysteinyl-tRNA synthetase [Fimbriiglobus ruber]